VLDGEQNKRDSMKIVVVGGTGLIGSKVVSNLTGQGHEVVAAAPTKGVNTLTGEGLAAVLKNAQIIIDVSNSPSFEEKPVMDFFKTSTSNLLKFGAAAGVRHLAALSVVGTNRLSESPYFRAKIVQEELIRESDLPYSIIHATQFFEFIKGIADLSTRGNEVRVAPALIQPMAADDVAEGVARVAVETPVNGIVEIAGPEKFRLDELIRRCLSVLGDSRRVIADPTAVYSGARLSERTLVPEDDAKLGKIRFEDWLAQERLK